MNDSLARIIRTIVQMVAAGSLTWLFEQVARDVPANYTPYVLGFSMLLVTAAQNYLEQTKTIPALLRPTGSTEEKVAA